MPRNETFILDSETATRAIAMRAVCVTAHENGTPVTVSYENRTTGEVSTRTVTVTGFVGAVGMSNDAVSVETDKGPRTFNTWLIRSAEIVEA